MAFTGNKIIPLYIKYTKLMVNIMNNFYSTLTKLNETFQSIISLESRSVCMHACWKERKEAKSGGAIVWRDPKQWKTASIMLSTYICKYLSHIIKLCGGAGVAALGSGRSACGCSWNYIVIRFHLLLQPKTVQIDMAGEHTNAQKHWVYNTYVHKVLLWTICCIFFLSIFVCEQWPQDLVVVCIYSNQ